MAGFRQALLFSMVAMGVSLQLGKTLPKVSTLTKEPRQVLETLNSQISSLEEGLAEKERESKQGIEQLKAGYESQLNAQDSETKKIKEMSKVLGQRAVELRDSNQALRQEAIGLEAECGKLEADLSTLKINISTAQEFAAMAFESSSALLDNATELTILAELENKELADRNNQLHQEQLKQVGKAPLLLQVTSTSTKGVKNPQELLESLMASLRNLTQEQNQSEAALKESFLQEYQVGVEKRLNVTRKQAEINATIEEGEALHEKLLAAVSHLKSTRDGLLEKSRSLRSYAKKVADAHEYIKSPSLLQLSAARHSPKAHAPSALPGVSQILSKPTEVYQSMNSNVNQLEQSLSEVEQKTAAEVMKQKAEYEHRLAEQAHDNKIIEAENRELSTGIALLKQSSASLRMYANNQAAKNENLRKDLEILQKNMTSAQEFASMAIAKAADLFNASQLSVLSELDAADAAHEQEVEHKHLLKSVAKSPELGLLELTATRGVAPDPKDLLQKLLTSLGDLAKEQNASAEALKANFEKQFQEGSERHTRLLREQAELTEEKNSEKELVERLKVALEQLKDTGSHLKEQHDSIQSFLGKLGPRPEAEAKAETELHANSSQHTKKHEVMSLAFAGKGEVAEFVSKVEPKDENVRSAKLEKKKVKLEKKMAMQKVERSVNVDQFLREQAVETLIKHPDSTQSKQTNGDEHEKNVKQAKTSSQTKHVKQAKAKKRQSTKTSITQTNHNKGKEQDKNVNHAKKATPAKDAKHAERDVAAKTKAKPAKPNQAKIEAAPAKADDEIQNKAEVMMAHASKAAAEFVAPIKQKISWLMR